MRGMLEELVSWQIFMPHGHCYLWKPGLVALQVGTNGIIGLAYLAITLTLVTLVRRVRALPFQMVYLAFGAFIVACGVTHFFDILTIWRPVYWLDGSVRLVTAIASAGTALVLPSLLPRIKELAETIALSQAQGRKLEEANAALQQARNELEARVVARTSDLERLTADLKSEIARRAEVEEMLRAREEDLRTTLHSIGDGVVVTDGRGHVVSMNPVAERLTGYALSDVRGRPLDEIFRIENEDTGKPVENPVHRVLREGVVVGLANHTNLVARDGTRCPIADSGAPIRRDGGELRGVILVFRDVSADRRAEEALRHWERIFQHATWGVALANISDLHFQAVNPAYARMHGYTVDELLGQPVSILWGPETRVDMEKHAGKTREQGHLVAETVHICKDGSPLPVEIVATTIKNAAGEVAWFVANVQDITERKRLQAVRDRALALEAENARIDEANRMKSEFLANMSHELRTPLNSIIGFAELIHDGEVGEIGGQQKEFLGDILSGGRHLLRLINDVLDLAKVEAGKMEFRPEATDLVGLTEQLVQSMRATADAKSMSVELDLDPSLRDLFLDPGRLKQILYNYLSNALKFTPDGGRVVVRTRAEGAQHFRIEVEDSGPGIPAAEVNRLFLAFQQLESSASKRHAGTGLGLALTKRLAEVQGGTAGFHPSAQGGSVFYVTLPRWMPGPDESSRKTVLLPPGAVLLVESDPHHRASLATSLAAAGYEVEAVGTCREALAAWQRRAHHAVALDLLTPNDPDLHALLHAIRTDRRKPDVPVMAVTVVADHGAAAGFRVSDILPRPLEVSALLTALERAGVPKTRGRPVLVVDDDLGSLRLMEATLTKLGYESLCFSDSAAAMEALKEVRPIALVLDVIMPGMDGLQFLERFRQRDENRAVPVMIWTVKDLSPEERARLQAAADAIVQKGGESRLSIALQSFLPAKASSKETGS